MNKKLLKTSALAFLFLSLYSCEEAKTIIDENLDQAVDTINSTSFTKEIPIDISSSEVLWAGEKVILGGHNGTVKFSEGLLEINVEGQLKNLNFIVDLNSIDALDLAQESENKAKLEQHLKNADFFDVETYPRAQFKTIKIDHIPENGDLNYLLIGELTIKNTTKTIEVPVQFYVSEEKIVLKADFTINRVDFGIVFHSKEDKTFDFEKMKDWAIKDIITLKAHIFAPKL